MKALGIVAILMGAFLAGIGFYVTVDSTAHAQAPATYGITTYADITGTGSPIQVDSTVGHSCRWIQLVTPSTNSATLTRWGDVNISSSRGGTMAAGSGQFLPPLPPLGAATEFRYNVTLLYVQPANGDKISVVCGQ